MSEAARIADQHRRAYDGEAWHGPAVFEVLADVDAARAAARPVAGAHTIWELVLHVRTWEDAVHQRLRGRAAKVTPEEDWPPVRETTPAAWKRALAALRETHDALNRDIEAVSDDRLDEAVPGAKTTIYQLLHGVVQHALYHAGQMALLKKG
ncbi:MAG: DinB family protein [Hyphomicrobiales bacterium]